MDAPRLPDKIRVERTDDDARMLGMATMQPDEVLAIERQYSSSLRNGKRQDLLVRDGLPRLACSSTHTGMRVRTTQGSPPQTPAVLAMPGK